MFAVLISLVARGAAEVLSQAQAGEEWGQLLEDTGLSHEEALQSVDLVIRNADPNVGVVSGQRWTVAARLPEYLEWYSTRLRGCGLRTAPPEGGRADSCWETALHSCLQRVVSAEKRRHLFGRIKDVARGTHLDGDEWCCWMPLTPRVLAVAGPRVLSCAGVRPLASQVVRQFNIEQCRRAQFVWCFRLIRWIGRVGSWNGTQARHLHRRASTRCWRRVATRYGGGNHARQRRDYGRIQAGQHQDCCCCDRSLRSRCWCGCSCVAGHRVGGHPGADNQCGHIRGAERMARSSRSLGRFRCDGRSGLVRSPCA